MGTREKVPVSVRLPRPVVEWMDRFGGERRWNRTTVIEAALEALRGGARGGAPAVPAEARPVTPRSSPRQRVVDGPAPSRVSLGVASAEDGGEGPSFGSSADAAHGWFGEHGGNYRGWRSRRDRWLRATGGRRGG